MKTPIRKYCIICNKELYLKNITLPWRADYTVEYDLHVNERNPYYAYQGQPFTGAPMLEGIYSKKTAFTIQSPGFAHFHYDSVASPTGIGLSYSALLSSAYSETDEPFYICCIDFYGDRQATLQTQFISESHI